MLQQTGVSRDQLREQIRQTVRDAQIAAEQAAKDAAKDADREGVQSGREIVIGVPPTGNPPVFTGTGVQINPENMIPPQAETISIAFFITVAAIIIGFPIMRAIARRIERGAPVAAPIPLEVRDQLTQISQSVEAIAIEVERISEGQRFTTKMLADRNREASRVSPGQ